MLRQVEWVAGVAAGLLSMPLWVYAGLTADNGGVGGVAQGAVARGQAGLLAAFLTLVCWSLIVAGIGAHLHARQGRRLGLLLLWAGSAACLVAIIGSGFPLLTGGAIPLVLAILAAVVGTMRGDRYRVVPVA